MKMGIMGNWKTKVGKNVNQEMSCMGAYGEGDQKS